MRTAFRRCLQNNEVDPGLGVGVGTGASATLCVASIFIRLHNAVELLTLTLVAARGTKFLNFLEYKNGNNIHRVSA